MVDTRSCDSVSFRDDAYSNNNDNDNDNDNKQQQLREFKQVFHPI